MSYAILCTTFQQIWTKLYNPKSGCPDVELGRVHCLFAEALAEHLPHQELSKVERFILAKTMLGESSPLELIMDWNGLDYYPGEYPKWDDSKPDEYDVAIKAYYAAKDIHESANAKVVEAAIEDLLAKGLVVSKDEGRRLALAGL